MGRLLMRFTAGMLGAHAEFDESGQAFNLKALPVELRATVLDEDPPEPLEAAIPLGRYELPRSSENSHVYRLQHPLSQRLIAWAQRQPLTGARLSLDYAAYGSKVSVLETLRGRAGACAVQRLRVESLGTADEYLLIVATCGDDVLEAEVADRLLMLPGVVDQSHAPGAGTLQPSLVLQTELARQRSAAIGRIETRNLKFFSAESDKLDAWADDQRAGLEQQIKELDRRIKETRTKGKGAATLAEKLDAQRQQRELEAARDKRRRELFIRQDEIQKRRDEIVDQLELQLGQRVDVIDLMAVEWQMA
jgi:hypothetical protein